MIVASKDREIQDLMKQIEQLEADKEAMTTSFEISARMMIERIKDLETPSFSERPNTA